MPENRQSITTEETIAVLFPDERSIPAEHRHEELVIQKEYLINGQLRIWEGPTQEVLSPVCVRTASGVFRKAIGSYPVLTAREAMEALDAAERAYDNGRGLWPSMPVNGRIAHIEEFLRRMQEKKKDITHLLMWEIGKSYDESEKEFARTIGYARNTIEALKNLDRASSKFVAEQGIIGQIRRAPLGVVLCMGPFNYPLNETFTTLIPALLMGNTVILKSPKLGVLLHRPLLDAFRLSFPPGVINTVYGDGHEVITPIVSSGRISVLAFIGSSKVADILKSQHPQPHRLRSVLGLEAKNPAIVLPDADMDLTVRECVKGSLSFNGQRCTALKILFVPSLIAETFLERFAAEIQKLKFGMPWDQDVRITPLPEQDKTDYLAGLVEDAKGHGARVVNEHGGAVNKTFFYPALLYPVTHQMRIFHEEQFGPVVPVVPYNNIEEPIQYCIDSSYGQQASIFGNDAGVIANLVDVLVNQVCRVNINSMCQRGPDLFPFAGRKDSGEGTLSVLDALRVFSIRTIIAAREIESNRAILEEIVNGKSADR
jgi:glyceraldehyde-3-phosphate dehydrogenase (NADP+)